MKNKVYLSIGSNIYPRIVYIHQAIAAIEKYIGKIISKSSIHQTIPWNMPEKTPFFYNLCLITETQFSPDEILDKIIFIEKQLGRIKKTNPDQVYQSRTIDIDILLFNDEIIDKTNLKIPHVHLHERLFVLLPLSEIAGELEHPVLKKKIKELLYDQLLVR